MKRIIFLAVATGIATSGWAATPTRISFLDRVIKVNEFQRDTDLRKRVLAECHDDPGQLKTDPNCINAQKAAVSAFLSDKPPRF